jgi:hypothetical protein
MELNTTYYNNNSRIVSGTPIVYQDDVILLCDTSTGAVTINLLEIPDNQWMTTYKLYIIDNSNNASVNNITINAGVGQLINDQPSITISTNGEGCLVRIISNNQYISTASGGVVSNALEVLDEGVSLTPNAASMNFVGDYVTATAVGNNVTVTIDAPDTGWVDLEGFEYQSAIGKPQCRKIGKQIHFRGAIIIPLSNDGGSTLIPIVNSNSYVSEWYNQVFTSTNGLNKGVTVNPDGTITFNLNSSVIPTTVLPAPTNLDGTYVNQIIGTRALADKANFGFCLSAFFQMIITTQKKLVIQTLIDFEQPQATAPNYLLGTMPLRFITSNIRQFDNVPNFTGATTYIQNGTGPSPFTLQSDLNAFGAGDYPLSVDAGQPNQIGGFSFRLDGLMAYIS